jgi:hypothetical protein
MPPKAAQPSRALQELLDATTTADIVTLPARAVLALEGEGAPESPAFQQSVAAVYGVAYTLKFSLKKARRPDFKIGPLEARWWTAHPTLKLPDVPRAAWHWELRIAVPDHVTVDDVTRAIEAATQRKGGKLENNPFALRVTRLALPAARCGRVLHVGPYADEGASFARIAAIARTAGLLPANAHSEIYLNDPRRTKPERLRTILLLDLTAPGSQ